MGQAFARCVWDSVRPEEGVKRRMGFELSEPIGTHKNIVIETHYNADSGEHYTNIFPANELFEAIPCGRPLVHREGTPLTLPMHIHGCNRPVRALQYLGFKANERQFNSDAPYPQPIFSPPRRSSGLVVRESDPYYGDEVDAPRERHTAEENYLVIPNWMARADAEALMAPHPTPVPEPTPEQHYVTVADLEVQPEIRPWRVWRTTDAPF